MPNIINLKKSNNRKSAGGAGAVGVAKNVGDTNVGAQHVVPLPPKPPLFISASRPRLFPSFLRRGQGVVVSPPRLGGVRGGRNRWVIGAAIFVALIVLISSFFIFKHNTQTTQAAAWFNDEWHYRQQFDVFNASTTEDLIDFQVEMSTSTLALRTAWSAGKLRNDFKDLRFTDSAGNLLDYWFIDATSTMMSVYVKMPSMPKNATSTVMMYYGNPSAPDKRDGNKVFPDFFDDFSDGTYAAGPRPWTVSSGAYSVAGTDKYLVNGTAGRISTPSTKAYGTWEFNWYKGADTNNEIVGFISDRVGWVNSFQGYSACLQDGNGRFYILKNNIGSNNNLIVTGVNYIAISTWYRFKITRTTAGIFTAYIKGGVYGNSTWTTIGTATDNTYTTSAYLFNYSNVFNASDRIDNILWRKFATTDPRVVATAGTSEETGGGPVGYWSFDEGFGATVYDRSGMGNHGALTNMSTTGTSTAWTTGKVNKALQFDGVNDYVNVGNVNKTVNSVGFWLNAKNLTKDIIDFDGGTHYITVSGGTLSATGFTSPTIYVNGKAGTRIQANNWHYITVTTATGFTSNNLKFGLKTSYFQGSLDEIKIYNYVLNNSQIKTEYNRGVSAKLSISPSSEQDIYQGLVGWWKMDEATTTWDGAGDRVNDYSGIGNHGTASGDAHATITAKYGNAAEFDGTDDYITIPSGATLAGKTQITVSAWVYADDFGVTSCIYCEQTSTAGNDRLGLYVNTNGKVVLTYRDSSKDPAGTATSLTGNATLSAATWYYITGVYDADTDKQIIYINGTEDKKATVLISGFGSSVANAIRIGDLNGDNEWDGYLDDVKIYGIARPPDQIMADYLQGPGPIASYNFEEKSGLTVNDISGFGHTGTITKGASKGFVKGRVGRAYDFDGANTKIDTGSDWIGTGNITISAWVYARSYGENTLNTLGTIISNGSMHLLLNGSTYYVPNNNTIIFFNSSGYANAPANSIKLNTWYHIVGTRSSAGISKIYLNGVYQNFSNNVNALGTSNVIIGARSALGYSFAGQIDDLKVYNYVLTPWQIAQEYNGGKPTAQWSFDEGQGAIANNIFAAMPGTLAGTLTNMSTTGTSTAWTTGKFGKALLFDGIDDTVTVTDGTGSGMDITSAGSLSAWVKPTSISGTKYIIDKDQNSAYALLLSGANVKGYFGNSSCNGGVVKANEWSYVSVAWDGAYIRCYLNGVEVNKTAYSTALTPQNTSLYLGSDGGAANWFKGIIDEPKVYQYALSPVQIKKDYNDGLAVDLGTFDGGQNAQNGLIGWYKMDEATTIWDGNGDMVNDYSGNNNYFTAQNHAHATTTAVYGNAAEFDGTDDGLNRSGLGPTIGGATQVTVETWVNARSFTGTPYIYIEQNSSGQGDSRLSLNLSTTGKVRMQFSDYVRDAGTATSLTGNATLSLNTWYYLTIVYNADTDKQMIYINGVRDVEASNAVEGFNATSQAIRMGFVTTGYNHFNGLIDDLKIYRIARTPDQIMQDYLQGPGPIASYNFEEKSGTVLNDISGQGHNGTITKGASKGFVKGKIGRAYDFDGANTKIDTGSDWIGTKAITISAWIYADSYGEDALGRIIENGGTMGFFVNGSTYYSPNNNTLMFLNNGTLTPTPANLILLNTWYHVAVTRTVRGISKIYINGNNVATTNSGSNVAGTTNVLIGNNSGQNETFDGQIDDLKVFNYVLTPWQIAQEYNNGKPVAYYKMDEGQNKTVGDWSGNGYNGTLSLGGSPATSTAWQIQAGCKVGKCLAFDGTDDYASIGSSLTVTGEATVSAWIRPNSTSAGAQVIIGDSNSGNTTQQLSLQLNNTAGKISGKWGNSTIITSNTGLQAYQWYYVTLVRGGTTGAWTAKIYINGALDNMVTTATNPSAVSSWSIGRAGAAASGYFNGKIDDLKIYAYAQSPAQIKNDFNAGFGSYFKNEWQCGDYLVDGRDNQSYQTVTIGNQCWMAQNLNIGTQVNSPAAASVTAACTGHIGETLAIDGVSCYCETADYASCQLNGVNGTIQKYCYNNTASMCTAEGGLYEWQQTMNLASSCAHTSCTPASGNQGICPAGWHIPTDAEFKTLEMNQGMSQAQADATTMLPVRLIVVLPTPASGHHPSIARRIRGSGTCTLATLPSSGVPISSTTVSVFAVLRTSLSIFLFVYLPC
ncbi:MAG: DUF2341 domain-containing protein [Candidatus Komeilibacteria bacterium]|nr:DUF2341 domain-containing protein [Candidatus Komeilibacteria bacterium]